MENNQIGTVRIVTYNTEAGGYDKGFDKISEDIRNLNADIVGFQEIDRYVKRSGNVDQVQILKEKTGLPYSYFTHAIDFCGGEYGTVILSRFPIHDFRVLPLFSSNLEKRAIGGGILSLGEKTVAFFNTHLSYENKDVRKIQFEEVATLLSQFPSFILTGDFNTEDYSEFACIKGGSLSNNDRRKLITFPPKLGIDNIVFSSDLTVENVLSGPEGHSDHCFLCADLRFSK